MGVDDGDGRIEVTARKRFDAGLLVEFGGIEIRLVESEGERLGDRKRFGDAGRLDDDGVELPLGGGELADGVEQVPAQFTADTAVREFDQLLVLVGDVGGLGDLVRVDVDLAHVVDEHRQIAVALAKHVVEYGRLSRTERSGQNRHGSRVVVHRLTNVPPP